MIRRLYALPLILFLALIVGLPLFSVIAGSFAKGTPFAHYHEILTSRFYTRSFITTLRLSVLTTLIGLGLSVLVAILLRGRSPRLSRAALVLGNLGANFAGVPAVLAFVILLGANGVLTRLLIEAGIIRDFDIYSLSGLVLAYAFFQVALGLVLVLPVIAALPTEVEEAARLMGIRPPRFWLRIGLPMVRRQLLAVATLLFANAMGTYATAFTLMGTNARIVTVRIGELVAGDVFSDPALANALSVCLMVLMLVPIVIGQWLMDRGRR